MPQDLNNCQSLLDRNGKHALFMVTDFAPCPSVGRIRTQKMCKFLPEFGWRTSVLTVDPPPGTRIDLALLAEVPGETKVHRVPCPQPVEIAIRAMKRLSGVRRHKDTPQPKHGSGQQQEPTESNGRLDFASKRLDRFKHRLNRLFMIPDDTAASIPAMVQRAVQLIRDDHVDLLVASVPGFSPWIAAVLAGRLTGVPVVVDYRDLWCGDVLRHWVGPIRLRLERNLERWALRRSSAVVSVSAGKIDYLKTFAPSVCNLEFATIYNGFDYDDVRGMKPVRDSRDAGRLLLVYAGKLYGNRRIDSIVAAIGQAVGSGRIPAHALRLRIYGSMDDPQAQRVAALVERHHLQDIVEYDGYVTRSESLARLLAADGLVLVVDPGETSSSVIPSKLTEYFALGRRILATCPDGEVRQALHHSGRAFFAAAEHPQQLETALTSLYDQWCASAEPPAVEADLGLVPTRRENAEQLAGILGRVVKEARESKIHELQSSEAAQCVPGRWEPSSA